jgi:general nucleoside transport system ATP-binding protein
MNKTVIELRGICKTFPGGIEANKDCVLSVDQGEVHAVVGENGAGKTTLMNILYGIHQKDEGEIFIRGEKADIGNPRAAKALGIQMVHQHFMLVPSFTVLQNIILGYEPRKGLFVDTREAVRQVTEICRRYHLTLPLGEKTKNLPVGVQQRAEIVKAIYRRAEILILDEPTAVLTPQEVTELFRICEEMVKDDKTILFISHKLKEVMRISNRVTVMRRGQTIRTLLKEETSEQKLARIIIGEEKKLSFAEHILKEDAGTGRHTSRQEQSPVILSVEKMGVRDNRGHYAVKDISLRVRAGEILGIAGVEGNGQTQLIEAIAGMLTLEKGDVFFKDQSLHNISIRKRRALGLRHIPEDRMYTGLSLKASICENLLIDRSDREPFLSFGGYTKWKDAYSYTENIIQDYSIAAPHSKTIAQHLSGGNMQKVVAARELNSQHLCLLVSHPTRGIDIGSADFIYRKIMDAKQKGAAILLISADLDELLLLSDRLLVIYEGRIAGEFLPGAISVEELGLYMTGAGIEDRK